MADESTNHRESLAAWNAHNSVGRIDTESTTHEFLRRAYPEYHITRTVPSKCDLLGYARAGHATSIRQFEEDLDATRVYRLPSSRMDETSGKLEDVVNFARWKYEWQGKDFIVYQLAYVNQFHQNIHFLFVLASNLPQFVHHGHHEFTDALLLASGSWTTELHEEIWVYDNSEWIKSKGLWKSVQGSSWDDVILNPAMKDKLVQDIEGFFNSRDMYGKLKIPWKRGLIFHGVPGNGKTISIKAIINALAKRPHPVQSLYVKSLDACSGPKWSIKQIFRKARRMAPCLLIFEDLDSLVGDSTRSYFLNEVDGLESNDGILMIGSTNHIEQLDPAVTKRPSRFDRKYHFKLPNEDERIAYCRYWRQKFSESDTVDFPDEMCTVIAQLTEEYSFAYLKELFITSLLLLARGGVEEVSEIKDAASSYFVKDTISQSSSVVPAKTTTNDVNTNENVTESKSSEEDTKQSTKRTVPEVDIPVSLQDNILLCIIILQAKSLLEEMDHGSSSAVQKVSGASRPPRIRLPWTSLLDEEDED
ncbi:ATP-dependent Zn protease [Trichoderma gamsii]|uniref:ATP-dependent Zn protease n=1 Tax=Trichoderma gamsii TaxID=398673 RepID=A0A2P4ZF48_9HYPO|nr:ATP-dependent Zn protease [Trichoderma gamsii]PON22921.1 ATP-dependent Zn protease [Trichoderma gamsii]